MNGNEQESGFISLRDRYQETVDRHNLTEVTLKRLLTPASSMKFIRNKFSGEMREPEIKSCIDRITPNRSVHMVSAYLFGLCVRDELTIDTRSWRRLPGEQSPAGSFELFWTWICLFHDMAYTYENDRISYQGFRQVDDLIEYCDFRYNLLRSSRHADLIRKYYTYRISQPNGVVDHGVKGGLMLYNALCVLSADDTVYSGINECRKFFESMADTVALHNMWRATKETLETYMDHDLYELIPDADGHHMIRYKDDPMLFLLALVDTIDPIKAFAGDRPKVGVYDILNSYKLKFINSSKKKEIAIEFDSIFFEDYARNLTDPESGMQTWLGVRVQSIASKHQLIISIDMK